MSSVELVLIMLLAVVASGYLVRLLPFALPMALVQIALGAVIAQFSDHAVTLDPELFFLLFLPPLLFLDGWRIPNDVLYRDRRLILSLAFGLVIFTVAGAGHLVHWMIPAIPLPVAFALAAIVSPTDPVAVGSILSRAAIPRRLMHILQGESLLNDASGLVCLRFAVAAALTGVFSPADASLTFLWVAVVGLSIGVVFVGLVALFQRWMSRRFGEALGAPILLSLLMPFGAYLVAEEAHASGILAAVAAGVAMSYVELSGRALAITRTQRAAVWNAVQFTLNGAMFVLLGEQLPAILAGAVGTVRESGHVEERWLAVYAVALMFGLWTLRFVWVWVSFWLTLAWSRRYGVVTKRPPSRIVAATTVAGVRGTVTLAGVMTLPLSTHAGTPFPARDLTIFLAASVILLSLAGASVLLPWLLKGVELPHEREDHKKEDKAKRDAAASAILAVQAARARIQDEIKDADISAHAAARVIDLYQKRIDDVTHWGDVRQLRKADEAEKAFRIVGLRAERDFVFGIARSGLISDASARRLVREIDLSEARYQ
ncbi:MAG: Na+/H+ antiporter [Vicinamibacteria bacterium]